MSKQRQQHTAAAAMAATVHTLLAWLQHAMSVPATQGTHAGTSESFSNQGTQQAGTCTLAAAASEEAVSRALATCQEISWWVVTHASLAHATATGALGWQWVPPAAMRASIDISGVHVRTFTCLSASKP